MATKLKGELLSLQQRVTHFAKQYIAGRDDLYSLNGFPRDIWDKMGEENLLGLNLPADHGGLGGSYLSTAVAAETLAKEGHNIGITVSWLTHLLVSRFFIAGFGNKKQHDTYLKGLAKGTITASIAISEPNRGAHPKHMETSGYRHGDSYTLNGEKAYLTNGPIADLFIVIATTGGSNEQKRFTAFLVSKDTAGLSITEPMTLDFFQPSPHGGILLSQCCIPSSNLLGKEGFAYEEMVKPFREVEDALMMALLTGGMERQMELLVNLIKKQGFGQTDELKKDLGESLSILHSLRIMAYEAAAILDSSMQHTEFLSLLISFKTLSKQFQNLFECLVQKVQIRNNADLSRTTNDLVRGIDSAKNISLIRKKKLGGRLLLKKGI